MFFFSYLADELEDAANSTKFGETIPLSNLDVNLLSEEEKTFTCSICGEEMLSKLALQKHIKSVHPLSKTSCKICSVEVLRIYYAEHIRKVHSSIFLVRDENFDQGNAECGKVKDEGQTMGLCQDLCKVEMTETSGENSKPVEYNFKGVDCFYCKQTYSNELNLKKHVYNVHRMQRVKCNVCDKEVTKKSLERHMKSVHSTSVEHKRERKQVPDDQKIPCYICPKKCVSLVSLRAHIKNIHEAGQFKCSQCDFHGNRKVLDRHIKGEHTKQVHQCQRCLKVLKSKSTLKEHMWIHTDHRRFICDICGMRFKRTSNYHGHMKSHQDKKFQCQLCGNFFLRKRYLTIHEQTIHDFYGKGIPPQEKGYQCEVCGVKLKWKNNLMAHMRIHTGEKPYKCKICSDEFTCHGSLRSHMGKHVVSTPEDDAKLFVHSSFLDSRSPPISTGTVSFSP